MVIGASHLRLLPLCAWEGKLSAKQWLVVRGQWRRAEGFGPCVWDGGRASCMELAVSPVPKSEGPGAPRFIGRTCATRHPDLWVGPAASRHGEICGGLEMGRLESVGCSRGLACKLLKIQQQNQQSVVVVGVAASLPGAHCDRFQESPEQKVGLAVIDKELEDVRSGT